MVGIDSLVFAINCLKELLLEVTIPLNYATHSHCCALHFFFNWKTNTVCFKLL